MIAVFIAASLAKKPASSHIHLAHGSERNTSDLDPRLPKFRMMARVALVMALMCMGLARSQVALLFSEELGYSESQYGIAMMVMCGAIWLIFFVVSRTHAWHYKFGIFMLIQLLTGLSMLIIIKYSALWALFLAVGFFGLGQSFVHSSHQFYAVSGQVKRSAPMAMHELLVAIGFIIGSAGGGYMASYFGRRVSPYWFGFAVICAGIAIQLVIWFIVQVKQTKVDSAGGN